MDTKEHLMGIREHEGHLDACVCPIPSFTSALCGSMSLREGELLPASSKRWYSGSLPEEEDTGSNSQYDVQ